jgi:hypothetical protein
MPRLSLGLGVQAVSKVKAGGAAPSGIPATTQFLNIDFGGGDPRSGTWTRLVGGSGPQWTNLGYSGLYNLVPPGFSGGDVQNWSFWDADQSNPVDPTNPSTDANFIPTSGWTNPSITITAA